MPSLRHQSCRQKHQKLSANSLLLQRLIEKPTKDCSDLSNLLESLAEGIGAKARKLRRQKQKRKSTRTVPNTRVSVVVINSDNQILLVKHRKGPRQYWVLPGGRMEYGETFFECGVREVKEETGIDVEVERIIFLSEAIAPDRSRHIVNVFMTAKPVGGTLKLGNEPVLAGLEFKPLEELRSLSLYPPVSLQVLDYLEAKETGIKYLGNLWV